MFNSRTISETDVLIGITYTKMLYVFLGLSVIPLYKIICIGKTCSARVLQRINCIIPSGCLSTVSSNLGNVVFMKYRIY